MLKKSSLIFFFNLSEYAVNTVVGVRQSSVFSLTFPFKNVNGIPECGNFYKT